VGVAIFIDSTLDCTNTHTGTQEKEREIGAAKERGIYREKLGLACST